MLLRPTPTSTSTSTPTPQPNTPGEPKQTCENTFVPSSSSHNHSNQYLNSQNHYRSNIMSSSTTTQTPSKTSGTRVGICVTLSATLTGAYKPQFLCWKPIEVGDKISETVPHILTKFWKKYETDPLSIFNPSLSQFEHFCKSLRASAQNGLVILHFYGIGLPEVAKDSIWLYLTASSKYHPVPISNIKSWIGYPTCIILDANGSEKVSNVTDLSALDRKFVILGRVASDTSFSKVYPMDFLSLSLLTPLRSSIWNMVEHQLNDPEYAFSSSPHKNFISERLFAENEQIHTTNTFNNNPSPEPSKSFGIPGSNHANPSSGELDPYLSVYNSRYSVQSAAPKPLPIKFRTKLQTFDKNETIQNLVGYNIEPPPESLKSPKETFFRLITKLHFTNTAVSISRVLRALADSISWDIVTKETFLEFFRAEQTLSTILRHYLIYISISPWIKFSKFQQYHIANTRSHPLWVQWKILLSSVFQLLYTKSPCSDLIQQELLLFFQSHLRYFESYKSWPLNNPPKSLPLLLHAFLTPQIRETSLISIVRFLQRGTWAVRELLDIGLIPYLTHSLKHDSLLSRQLTLLAIGSIIHQSPDHTFLICEQATFFSLLSAINSPASSFRMPALYIIAHILSYCLLPANLESSQSIPGWFAKYHLFDKCTLILQQDQNVMVTQWTIITLSLLATAVPTVLTGNYASKFGTLFGNMLWTSPYSPIRINCIYALTALLVLNDNLHRSLNYIGSDPDDSGTGTRAGHEQGQPRMRGLELANFSLVAYSCPSSYDGDFVVRATWIHFLYKFLGFYTRDLAQASIQVYLGPISGEIDATTLEGVVLQIWSHLQHLLSDPSHLVMSATLQLLIRINTLNFSLLTEDQITELHSLPPLPQGAPALDTILREFQKYHLIPLFAPSKKPSESTFSLHWVHEVAGISAEISTTISHSRLVSDSFADFAECVETGINSLETEKYFAYLTSITLPSFNVSLLNTPVLNLVSKNTQLDRTITPAADFPIFDSQQSALTSVHEELASKTISFSAPFEDVQKRLQTLDHPDASSLSFIYSSTTTFRTFWRSFQHSSSLTAQGIFKFQDDIANHLIFHPHDPFLYCVSSSKIYSIDLSSNSFPTKVLDPFYRPPVQLFDSWATKTLPSASITHAQLLDTFSDKLVIANDRGDIQIWRNISSLHSSEPVEEYLQDLPDLKKKHKKGMLESRASDASSGSWSRSPSYPGSGTGTGSRSGNINTHPRSSGAGSSLSGVYSSFSKYSKLRYSNSSKSLTEPTLISAFKSIHLPSNKKKISLKFASSRKNGLLFCAGDVSILTCWDIARQSRISTIRTVPDENMAPAAVSYLTTSTGSDFSDCVLWLGYGDGKIRALDIRMPAYFNFTHVLDNQIQSSYITGIRITTSQTVYDSTSFRNWKCNAYSSNGSYIEWDMRSPQNPVVSNLTQRDQSPDLDYSNSNGSDNNYDPIPLYDSQKSSSTLTVKTLKLGEPGNLLCFHPNLNLMALSTSKSIRLLSLLGKEKYNIPFHDDFLGNRMGQITGLGFHPYDRILAAASGDGLICLYSPTKLYTN